MNETIYDKTNNLSGMTDPIQWRDEFGQVFNYDLTQPAMFPKKGLETFISKKLIEAWEAGRDAYTHQGVAVEKQERKRQRDYFDAILKVFMRHPLMWEAMYAAVNKKEIDYSGLGHHVATNDHSMGMSALRCCDNGDIDEEHDCLKKKTRSSQK